jgi:hypothetical protein
MAFGINMWCKKIHNRQAGAFKGLGSNRTAGLASYELDSLFINIKFL